MHGLADEFDRGPSPCPLGFGLGPQLVFILISCSLFWNVVTEEADGEYSGRHHAANFDTCSILLVWALGAVVVNSDGEEASKALHRPWPPLSTAWSSSCHQCLMINRICFWGESGALADPAVTIDNPRLPARNSIALPLLAAAGGHARPTTLTVSRYGKNSIFGGY